MITIPEILEQELYETNEKIRLYTEELEILKDSENFGLRKAGHRNYDQLLEKDEERTLKIVPASRVRELELLYGPDLKKKIKRRKFLEASLKWLHDSKTRLENMVKYYKPFSVEKVRAILPLVYQDGAYSEFIDDDDEFVRGWKERKLAEKEKYPPKFQENIIQRVSDDLTVRTKAEMLTALELNYQHIPFVYEAPLKLKTHAMINGEAMVIEQYRHPDFTTLNLVRRSEKYVEVAGMMLKDKYRANHQEREWEYLASGYVEFRDYIFLYDSGDGSIDRPAMKQKIKAFMEV